MIPEGAIVAKTTSIVSRLKRRSILDILFIVGVVLVIIGFVFLCVLADTPIFWLPAGIIGLGVLFLLAGLIVYFYLLFKRPEMLSPEDAQINAKVATLLTDNISEESKIKIAQVLMSPPPPKQLGS